MEQQDIIIYKTAHGKASVALYAREGDIWLNQKQMENFLLPLSRVSVSM